MIVIYIEDMNEGFQHDFFDLLNDSRDAGDKQYQIANQQYGKHLKVNQRSGVTRKYVNHLLKGDPRFYVQNRRLKLRLINDVKFFYFNLNQQTDFLQGFERMTKILKIYPLTPNNNVDEERGSLHKTSSFKDTPPTKPRPT